MDTGGVMQAEEKVKLKERTVKCNPKALAFTKELKVLDKDIRNAILNRGYCFLAKSIRILGKLISPE